MKVINKENSIQAILIATVTLVASLSGPAYAACGLILENSLWKADITYRNSTGEFRESSEYVYLWTYKKSVELPWGREYGADCSGNIFNQYGSRLKKIGSRSTDRVELTDEYFDNGTIHKVFIASPDGKSGHLSMKAVSYPGNGELVETWEAELR